ncbi:hypothetical protein ES703_110570 [subsurface metagenome]
MRILGFSTKDWINYHTGKPKLKQPVFTTFRLRRRDKDWQTGELVQVVFKPRSKNREPLGIAEIVKKEQRCLLCSSVRHCRRVVTSEAEQDGFSSLSDMETWLLKAHGSQVLEEPINKLLVRWVNGES